MLIRRETETDNGTSTSHDAVDELGSHHTSSARRLQRTAVAPHPTEGSFAASLKRLLWGSTTHNFN
jgi:hypothetical protein